MKHTKRLYLISSMTGLVCQHLEQPQIVSLAIDTCVVPSSHKLVSGGDGSQSYSALKRDGRSVALVLDEFHVFAKPKQSLLYTILDAIASTEVSSQAPCAFRVAW